MANFTFFDACHTSNLLFCRCRVRWNIFWAIVTVAYYHLPCKCCRDVTFEEHTIFCPIISLHKSLKSKSNRTETVWSWRLKSRPSFTHPLSRNLIEKCYKNVGLHHLDGRCCWQGFHYEYILHIFITLRPTLRSFYATKDFRACECIYF
jgi:hypothetical protein